MPNPITHLSPEQVDDLGRELDDLRSRTVADLGERDRQYLQNVVRAQRGLEVAGRALLFAGFVPPAWVGGVLPGRRRPAVPTPLCPTSGRPGAEEALADVAA